MKKLSILLLSLMLMLMMGCGNSDSPKSSTSESSASSSSATANKAVKEQAPEAKANAKTAANEGNNAIKDSVAAFKRYHKLITDKDYEGAYAMLGQDLKSEMPFNSYRDGYATTVSSVPYEVRVTETGIDKIVLKYKLRATDKGDNGKNVTKVFTGTCEMVKTNGDWIINSLEAKSKD